MFDLRDLPDAETLERFRARHPELDITALQVVLKLARVAGDVIKSMEAYLAEHELSLRRFFTLVLLERNPDGLRASGLAERMDITKATVSVVLAGMRRDGLVHMTQDAGDARATVVTITPRGHDLLHAVLPEHYRRTAAMLDGVDDATRRVVLDVLAHMERRIP